MTRRKVVAFLGTCMFFLGGAFFSQGADLKTANPYERAFASNFFAQDAAAWNCGTCEYNFCEDPGYAFSECQTYTNSSGNEVCEERADESCSY